MKKVLALVLAVMMMATVAFAAVQNPDEQDAASLTRNWRPGQKIKINDSGIVTIGNAGSDGNTYYLFSDPSTPDPLGANDIAVKNINSTNYSISNLKYKDGKNLVESIKFNDDDDVIEIKLKQDYDNTKAKDLELTFTLKGKKVGKSAKPKDIDVVIKGRVGYYLDDTTLLLTNDDEVQVVGLTNYNFAKNTLYKVAKPNGADAYGTLEFDGHEDDDVSVSVRVYEDDELYLYNDADASDAILKAYADADADITFINFPGEPTFNSTATVYFYKEEDSHIYQNKDGKLVACNAKWSDDDGAFILKTRTLGSYVFSDKALNVSASTAADNNPDTGANDVVGIAGALAAVALVSAAAVSLKK